MSDNRTKGHAYFNDEIFPQLANQNPGHRDVMLG